MQTEQHPTSDPIRVEWICYVSTGYRSSSRICF